MTRNPRAQRLGRSAAVGALCALLTQAGCGLDKVEIPGLTGPSTTGIALELHATPDVLLADAESTAVVQAIVRGPDGQPLGGRTVFFAVTDENGAYVDLGTLYSTVATYHPPAPQTTEVTGTNGIAQVVYRLPGRISVTAIQPVNIQARVVGDDARAEIYRSVQIELRPAEVRRYPPNNENTAPDCSFTVDPEVPPNGAFYPTHFTVRFHTTSSDEDGQIVRYYWDFGDGSFADKPDTEHAWARDGNYPVTHVVTDNNGAVDVCSVVIGVND